MLKLRFISSLMTLACLATLHLWAQNAAPPDVYSVTEANNLGIDGMIMKIDRNGSKALVTMTGPDGKVSANLYDFKSHTTYSWDPKAASPQCSSGTFSGDWGDPFAMMSEIDPSHPKQTGSATILGTPVKIYEATMDDGSTAKAWVGPSRLLMRLIMTEKGGTPKTIVDVKQLSFAAPPASAFVLPASCAGGGPVKSAENDRIAAETGGNPANFANAIAAPDSHAPTACTVVFKVVHAGTMEPITSGFKISLDTAPSGGTLRDVTGTLRNGALWIPNAPDQFNLGLTFASGGVSNALIYRRCVGPQTVLLLVVKNPAKVTDGTDWLRVKAGKYVRP